MQVMHMHHPFFFSLAFAVTLLRALLLTLHVRVLAQANLTHMGSLISTGFTAGSWLTLSELVANLVAVAVRHEELSVLAGVLHLAFLKRLSPSRTTPAG